jgi:hypothetical protein
LASNQVELGTLSQQLLLLLLLLLLPCSDPDLLQKTLSRPEVMAGAVEVQLLMYISQQPAAAAGGGGSAAPAANGCVDGGGGGSAAPAAAAAIGPVKLMWHPRPHRRQQQQQQQQQQQWDFEQAQQQQEQEQQQKQQPMEVDRPHQQQQQGGRCWQRRQHKQQQELRVLWLWCHASYLQQLTDTLTGLIQQQQQQQQQQQRQQCRVTLVSLGSNLRRVELLGPFADSVLRSVVTQQQLWQQHPQQQQQQQQYPQQQQRAAPVGNAVWGALSCSPLGVWQSLPQGSVLGLAAVDPRLAKPPRHTGAWGQQPDPAAAPAAAAGHGGGPVGRTALQQLLMHWPANGEEWLLWIQ